MGRGGGLVAVKSRSCRDVPSGVRGAGYQGEGGGGGRTGKLIKKGGGEGAYRELEYEALEEVDGVRRLEPVEVLRHLWSTSGQGSKGWRWCAAA